MRSLFDRVITPGIVPNAFAYLKDKVVSAGPLKITSVSFLRILSICMTHDLSRTSKNFSSSGANYNTWATSLISELQNDTVCPKNNRTFWI